MPILDVPHDFGHAVDADPNWSESYYFNAYSPLTDTGFFARIAVRPNEPHVDGFITVWLPSGNTVRLAESRGERVPSPATPMLNTVGFERIEPMKTWRICGDGVADDGRAVQVDATFSALTPPIGVDASGAMPADHAGRSVMQSLASGHFEQAGCYVGSVTVDGRQHMINGHGNRDKSWGPRRTDGARGMHFWRWFSLNFGDDIHLGGIRVGTAAGDLQRGWLWRRGQALSLRELAVDTALEADGLRQRALTLTVRDKEGATHVITGEVLRSVPLRARGHDHMTIFEGLTRWRYDGAIGYGICEYAHQLDADGRPVVAIV